MVKLTKLCYMTKDTSNKKFVHSHRKYDHHHQNINYQIVQKYSKTDLNMSLIKIINIEHASSECKASEPLTLNIALQCMQKLDHDIELKTV